MKTIHRYSLLFLYLAILMSCSSKTEIKTITVSNINFEFESPIYAGPNSATAELSIDLSKEIGEGFEIKDVKLKNASIVTDSTTVTADNLQSITLQIGSSNQPLISVAVLNPTSSTSLIQQLNTSNDKNLASYLLDKSFYLVLDPDFINDSEEMSLRLEGTFEFEIHYTNK